VVAGSAVCSCCSVYSRSPAGMAGATVPVGSTTVFLSRLGNFCSAALKVPSATLWQVEEHGLLTREAVQDFWPLCHTLLSLNSSTSHTQQLPNIWEIPPSAFCHPQPYPNVF
jgi:hypothetical protein